MKTPKPIHQSLLVKIFSGILLLTIVTCCERSFEDQTSLPDPSDFGEQLEWQNLLKLLDPESDIIIVQNDASIQDAINEAEPGDAVCIEPGHYHEILSIDKSDVRIIGLGTTEEGSVILENPESEKRSLNMTGGHLEIFNIQLRNYAEDDVEISTLGYADNLKCGHRFNVEREYLGNGIAHYMIDMPMGWGEFDVVRIHRVVKECRPHRPVRTDGDIFMVHGAIQDFDDIFLTVGAEVINEETSSPYYLAANNIDVWGIDLAWTKVPMETTDFTFMKDWGVDRDICHVLKAMSIARLIRGMTRQGYCRMNLLGFSYGVSIAYGSAGKETQMHCSCRRNIKGIIPVDNAFKLAPELDHVRVRNCKTAAFQKSLIEGGLYQNNWGVGIINNAILALEEPDQVLPQNDPLTNYEVVIDGATPGFVGGDLDMGMLYTDPDRWIRFSAGVSPYMPMQMFYDMSACRCDEAEFDVKFGDHLAEISVPILFIGAGGSGGLMGFYSSSLTASSDITNHLVTIPDFDTYDYGHADLWIASDAQVYVWDVLRQWLLDH